MILDQLLEVLRPLGYPLRPYGSEEIEDCIVYNFVPVSSDKIKEQNRLEITVIALSVGKGLEMLEEIKEALLTLGDQNKTDNILEISLNGGGSLENIETKTFHFKAFFIVKSRYGKD